MSGDFSDMQKKLRI